jgi:site-specific DNA-methyltransferase (adenine-specific)
VYPVDSLKTGVLFYGDNLPILRDHIPDESVDLVYLDPPFNSNRSYNVLFRDESGHSEAQIEAFEDTWHWGETAEQTYYELWTTGPDEVSKAVVALRQLIGTNQVMAYLVMMAARLVELHRVLKPTGSLYLHCDPTAGHYLKVVLDTIFDPRNFRNEIIWKRTSAHSDAKQGLSRYGRIHDVILFYGKSQKGVWNTVYMPYDKDYIERIYRYVDESGRRYQTQPLHAAKAGGDTLYEWKGQLPPPGRYWAFSKENMEKLDREGRIVYSRTGVPRYKIYLDESPGVSAQDLWTDIAPVHNLPSERLGYPTQKPLALLERIITASSNPGDVVLDPFCGCGTAIAAAQTLERRWIGIDVTHLSIALLKYRLKKMFEGDALAKDIEFDVIGEPEDLGAAHQLAQDDRHQFEWWALSLVRAKPRAAKSGGKTGKKGADKGIDGFINFMDGANGDPKRVLVQVKSGHVQRGQIAELRGTVERENAAMGVFITLEEPTKPMREEALEAGYYHSPGWGRPYPRIQILTIGELLHGAGVKMPPQHGTFKEAQRVRTQEAESLQLGVG